MAPRTVTTNAPVFIQLSKITGSEVRHSRNQYNDSDEDTGQAGVPPTGIPSTPVVIAVDSIRCYNARKNREPGTRLTFKDGGGFAVLQSMDAIAAAIGLEIPVVEVPAPAVALATSEGAAVN